MANEEPPYHLPAEKMFPEGQRHWRDETWKGQLLKWGEQLGPQVEGLKRDFTMLAMVGVPGMALAAAADWRANRRQAHRQAALQRQAAANLARMQQQAAQWRQVHELREAAAVGAPPGINIPGLAPRHMVMRGLVARSASPGGRRTGGIRYTQP